jgi:hypothetical protein
MAELEATNDSLRRSYRLAQLEQAIGDRVRDRVRDGVRDRVRDRVRVQVRVR